MGAIPYYWRLSGFYLFYFALLGTLVPYWALYLQQRGFSAAEIGLLMALPQITKLVAPVMWGWLADRSGNRLAVIRSGNFIAALAFCAVFYADNFWLMAAVLISFSFFWNAVLAQFEALTLELLGARSGRYGQVRLWGSIGFIVTVCLVGLALDRYPVSVVPWVMLATLWLIWLCTLTLPPQHRRSHHHSTEGLWWLMTRPAALCFFLAAFLMQMSHGPYYTFFSIYLDEHGFSRIVTGALWALGVFAEVLLFIVMHRFLGRYRLATLLVASMVLAALRWVLIGAFVMNWPLLVFAQCLHAASFGLFHAASIAWVHRHFGRAHAGQGQALYSSVGFGAGWALGAVLSGLLWEALGAQTFFWAALAAALAALVAGAGMLRPGSELPQGAQEVDDTGAEPEPECLP